MINSQAASILAEFDRAADLYKDLVEAVTSLLRGVLGDQDIQLHSIAGRCKSKKSLDGKLARPDKNYCKLSDITDLAAVRVTTYFSRDVDNVASVVEREFDVDENNSIDKRASLDADRFGYQSVHYVVSINSSRTQLPEYRRYSGLRFEIQIRSILQHAWAEIEHDLGYKSVGGVPKEIRRRFSRIAGLLELADQEFCEIRGELISYAKALPAEIAASPQVVGIDRLSLAALLDDPASEVFKFTRRVIDRCESQEVVTNPSVLDIVASGLKELGVNSVAELEHAAAERVNVAEDFAFAWLGKRHSIVKESGLMYLLYTMLAESGDHDRVRAFIKRGFGHDVITPHLFSTYEKIRNRGQVRLSDKPGALE
jgi:ppGpp synthetase/RelA/SpoT-type nucleotidyltranferase